MNNYSKSSSILDPVVKTFLDALAKKGGTPIYKLSPIEARKVLSEAQAGTIATLPADIEDRTIPDGPKGSINVRIVRPKGNTTMLPVVLYMHGGGWVLGDTATHDRLIREIANGAQAAVVFVDYTRAPEGQYPVIHEEGYAVAKWIAQNGKTLNLDASRMAIAGDSVGGLLATAIVMMAQERSGPKFIFQLLFYPVTDASFNTPSYEQFATGYFLEREGMKWFWDNYVPDKKMRESPLVCPLKASLEQLKKMPPTLFIVGENDILRDEGEAYAHKLMQAGVSIAACRYLGMMHDFVMLNAIAQAAGVRAAIAQANQWLAHAFTAKK
jgi:acetyl esterase